MQEQESIFRSVVRTFFKTLFVILAIFVGMIPFFLISSIKSKAPEMKNTITYGYDLKGNNDMQPLNSPVILRINIEGEIGMKNNLKASIIQDQLYESRKGLLKNDRVKAVLVYLRTPGGTTNDSEAIYRMLKTYKETYKVPVYAYAEHVVASGGMYIACAADKIYTDPSCMVGSIGVITTPLFNVKNALENWGILTHTFFAGKGKDDMSPFKTWQPDEEKNYQEIIDYLYDRFVTDFTQARSKVTKNQLINEYGAAIFTAKKAEAIGYIDDGNSTYDQALKDLLAVAKIDENKPYQIVEMKPKFTWIADLVRNDRSLLSDKLQQILHLNKEENTSFHPFLYKYEP